MKLLAMDTACGACSAAVWANGAILAARSRVMQRGHVETLLPMTITVMEQAGLAFGALDLIAVTRGPGSFTGLRAGLAAARGLALALGLPLVAVTTLEAVARAAAPTDPATTVLAAIETRRADLYVQAFSAAMEPLDDPRALSPAAAAALAGARPTAIAGDGADRVLEAWRANPTGGAPEIVSRAGPDAAIIAEMAAVLSRPRGAEIAPLYLHPPEATRPAAGGRLRP
ncbi:MAG: tRNA (adenosine(37)-N6)-threonylcarbamoyltransferase complex dimerization subunit type 1 TsaB [Alphaproteobacteria bacterium]